MKDTKTISVKTATWQKLVGLGRRDQTHDDVINELIEQKKESGV